MKNMTTHAAIRLLEVVGLIGAGILDLSLLALGVMEAIAGM